MVDRIMHDTDGVSSAGSIHQVSYTEHTIQEDISYMYHSDAHSKLVPYGHSITKKSFAKKR